MNKKYLEEKFRYAKENKMDICVEVTIPGQEDTEYIINKYKSLDNKLSYYLDMYDDLLVHKKNDQILIVNITPLNFYLAPEFVFKNDKPEYNPRKEV